MARGEAEYSPSDPSEAFGDPDGSRTEVDDVVRDFVGFEDHTAFRGLAVTETNPRTRVVVGGKGAGKSRYLRRFAAAAREQSGVFVDDDLLRHSEAVQKDAPSTLSVVKVAHSVGETYLTERWQQIWRRAIFRSLVSHLLHNASLTPYVAEEERDELLTAYTALYRRFRRPLSIYSQVTEIVTSQTRSSLGGYLEHHGWHDLEGLVADIVRRCPPLYFYIDAIDDEYAHAPSYWLRCQKGLFYTVMKLAKDEFFGARLHVVIGVRDHVLSSVLRSEHATRYRDSPYVRSLIWTEQSLRFFLDQKLRRLPDEFFASPGMRQTNPLTAWVGFPEVANPERQIRESIEYYILRHTRMSPRDIVQLGNRLTVRIASARSTLGEWREEDVRATIAELAAEWGEEQLTICARQMSADMMPPHAADQDYGEVFTGALAYAPAVFDSLRTFLVDVIQADRFDRETLLVAREMACEFFDERTDVFAVLWQNGLLGYGTGDMSNGYERFYRINEQSDAFLMPEHADFYALHSCLIDAIGIEPVGSRPVLGFRASRG